ncbi:MAG: hypothetical protein Q7S14_03240 [bacterium]|nr:hypothetical protein [bacterium]
MTNDVLGLVLLLLFSGAGLFFILYFHLELFRKYLLVIIKTNILVLLLWFIGGGFAYRMKIWEVPFGRTLGIKVFEIQMGDLIYSFITTTLITMVVIIMYKGYQKNLRFRDYFFKKE